MKKQTFSNDEARGFRRHSRSEGPNKHLLDASTSLDERPGPSQRADRNQKFKMTEEKQEKEEKNRQERYPLGFIISCKPATMLQAGSWIKVPRRRDDIVATIYSSKCFAWEFFDEFGFMVKRIVIPLSNIVSISANIADNEPGILGIELANPPKFFNKEWGLEPLPWQETTDFTDGQASTHRRQYVQFSCGILEKFFGDYFQYDSRLLYLLQVPFPSVESLYFDVGRHNIGVALNPAITPYGGTIIYIVSTVLEQGEGKGAVFLTRPLGQNFERYAHVARGVAQALLYDKEPENTFFEDSKLQLDVPSTAMICAGCTMVTSMLSLAMQKPVKMDLAMCGRVDGSGKILKVEGLKHFTIAARRKRVKTLIFPSANREDFNSLAPNEKGGLDFHFVETFSQIFDLVFCDA